MPSRQHALNGEERVDAEHHGRQDPSGALGQEVDLDVSVGFEHEGLKVKGAKCHGNSGLVQGFQDEQQHPEPCESLDVGKLQPEKGLCAREPEGRAGIRDFTGGEREKKRDTQRKSPN